MDGVLLGLFAFVASVDQCVVHTEGLAMLYIHLEDLEELSDDDAVVGDRLACAGVDPSDGAVEDLGVAGRR